MVCPQRVHRASGHVLHRCGRYLCGDQHAAGCDSGSFRRAGDHLHRVSGPGAAGGGRPGHLSAEHGHAGRAEIQGGARAFGVRRVVHLRHFRGRHRYLLGTNAGAGISQLCVGAHAAGRHPHPGAGRHGRRLGVPVRRDRGPAHAGGTAHDSGLVRALPAHQGPGRGGSGERGRLCQDLSGHGGATQIAGLRHSAQQGQRGDPGQQPGRGRPSDRDGGDRIRRPRPRLSTWRFRHRESRGQGRKGYAGADSRRGAGRIGAG